MALSDERTAILKNKITSFSFSVAFKMIAKQIFELQEHEWMRMAVQTHEQVTAWDPLKLPDCIWSAMRRLQSGSSSLWSVYTLFWQSNVSKNEHHPEIQLVSLKKSTTIDITSVER